MITGVSLRPHIAWNAMLKIFVLKSVLKLHKYEQKSIFRTLLLLLLLLFTFSIKAIKISAMTYSLLPIMNHCLASDINTSPVLFVSPCCLCLIGLHSLQIYAVYVLQ